MLHVEAMMRPAQERMNDVLLFFLAQNVCSDTENWRDALDDLLGELTEIERYNLAEACYARLRRVWQAAPPTR